MRARPPPAPDFPALLRALQQHGLRSSAIAKELRVAPSTVCSWLNADACPGFSTGAELLALACVKASAAVPRELVPLVLSLSTVVVGDLRAANAVVADLRSAALRL